MDTHCHGFCYFTGYKIDGLVKSPTSALCCISQSFNVRKVHLMITKFARLEFELFTKPSKLDFLRVHQNLLRDFIQRPLSTVL